MPIIESLTDAPKVEREESIPEQNNQEETLPGYENAEETEVSVGIMSDTKICFTIHGTYSAKGHMVSGEQEVVLEDGSIRWNGQLYRDLTFRPQVDEDALPSFSLHNVTIGLAFHWERQETQTFQGILRLVVHEDKIVAINKLSVEDYLVSVISSEMNANCPMEFLKAAAVISRSWLIAQIHKRKSLGEKNQSFFTFTKTDKEIIRWHDREDHTIFDVCADDHCQRYQGITRATNAQAKEAVESTRGEVLMYEGEICDARFSKCCGGKTEEFKYAWEDTEKPYLQSIEDPYCNTQDKELLAQVLNSYDQETTDFYEWEVVIEQEKLGQLLLERLGYNFGKVMALNAIERGPGGHISKLKIVGTEHSMVIGKELEIRRTLSESHLLSSAFEAYPITKEGENAPSEFLLKGRGWGHGVGMCQIGAAVMGQQGHPYQEILTFYYRGADIIQVSK
ncbi:MAG: SpoIID/LytB domain-containing protein [Bacteroidaceae bacterium]|nr:SpoIID/LytB domain-containing protein [Bacteroidaceae bacterium]